MIGLAGRRQLNIYVPNGDEAALARLRELSARTGRPINRLVLEAISDYVRRHASPPPAFRTFGLGVKGPVRRGDVYGERLDRKLPG